MPNDASVRPPGGYPPTHGRLRADDSPSDAILHYNHAPAAREATTSAKPQPPSPGTRPFIWIAVAAGTGTGPLVPTYLDTHGDNQNVRSLLFLSICVLVISCIVAVMLALRARCEDRRTDELRNDIRDDLQAMRASIKHYLGRVEDGIRIDLDSAKTTMNDNLEQIRQLSASTQLQAAETAGAVGGNQAMLVRLAGMADLPDVLKDRTAEQGKVFIAELREACKGMRTQMEQIAEGIQATSRRLAALERRVDEQEEHYEKGWVDGAARTAAAFGSNGHGTVTRLHPPAPPAAGRR